MESQIEKLLERYWAGESSLEEEQQLKAHFAKNPSVAPEGLYFRGLSQKQQVASGQRFSHPGKSRRRAQWSAAAAVVIGIMAAVLVFQDAKKQQREFVVEDPQEAYEVTRRALLMVSSGLNEGKTYSGELSKLNKAEEIIQE